MAQYGADGQQMPNVPTPLATVPSFVFKFRIVIQHRHRFAIYVVRRKLGAASRDSLRNDTCILCGNCFNREIPRPQLDATNLASLVKNTNSPESLLILQSVTTVHFFSFFCDSGKRPRGSIHSLATYNSQPTRKEQRALHPISQGLAPRSIHIFRISRCH